MQLLNDFKFEYKASTATTLGPADFVVSGKDVISDSTFETCVTITLGTDARAADSDVLPAGVTTRRGYWANNLLGVNLGCKLWLLGRSKLDNLTVALAKQYVEEGFNWMVSDGIVSSVEVTVSRYNSRQLNFFVVFVRPDLSEIEFKFFANWESNTIGNLNVN